MNKENIDKKVVDYILRAMKILDVTDTNKIIKKYPVIVEVAKMIQLEESKINLKI